MSGSLDRILSDHFDLTFSRHRKCPFFVLNELQNRKKLCEDSHCVAQISWSASWKTTTAWCTAPFLGGQALLFVFIEIAGLDLAKRGWSRVDFPRADRVDALSIDLRPRGDAFKSLDFLGVEFARIWQREVQQQIAVLVDDIDELVDEFALTQAVPGQVVDEPFQGLW